MQLLSSSADMASTYGVWACNNLDKAGAAH